MKPLVSASIAMTYSGGYEKDKWSHGFRIQDLRY